MRFPGALPGGGTIGFAAPSFGCATEPYYSAFGHALEKFGEMGYRHVLGPNVYASDGIGISSTPQNCGEELTKAYCSKESDVLISCGGGELMCEILDYVDWDRLRSAPAKWYLGYSDNTNFTFLQNTLCDTAAIYGPCAASFGMEPWHPCLDMAMQVLQAEPAGDAAMLHFKGFSHYEMESLKDAEHPLAPYHCTEPSTVRAYAPVGKDGASKQVKEAAVEGRLLGGCLDCLSVLVGTKFDRVSEFNAKYGERDGILWFLEACDLNPMSIRRSLWQLEHAGWFDRASGFLIGRPMHHGEVCMGLDQYEAVVSVLGSHKVPILMDLDFGHIPPAVPLLSGGMAKAGVKAETWDITMWCR